MDQELLSVNYITLDSNASSKQEALEQIANFAYQQGIVDSAKGYLDGLVAREEEVTTGFGNGVAIPHARVSAVKKGALIVMKFSNPIEWESLDDEPVEVALAIAMPDDNSSNSHLTLLSTLARKLMHQEFVSNLKQADSKERIYEILKGE